MNFLMWFSKMQEPSWYILTRCVFVACAMLGSAAIALMGMRDGSIATAPLLNYADHTLLMSGVVLGAGVVGSALMEDILGRR